MSRVTYCAECRMNIGKSVFKKHLEKIPHKTKLYRQDYEQLCHYANCMHKALANGYCKPHKHKATKKLKIKYKSLDDVKCPVCKGVINSKWFNFRNGNTIEFIAECWSGDLDRDTPRHIFYFQIEVPNCIMLPRTKSWEKRK